MALAVLAVTKATTQLAQLAERFSREAEPKSAATGGRRQTPVVAEQADRAEPGQQTVQRALQPLRALIPHGAAGSSQELAAERQVRQVVAHLEVAAAAAGEPEPLSTGSICKTWENADRQTAKAAQVEPVETERQEQAITVLLETLAIKAKEDPAAVVAAVEAAQGVAP